MLNIAFIGHKRIPSREGGVEIVVEQLSTRMAMKGLKVTCFNRAGHHVSGAQYDIASSNPKFYKGIRVKTVLTFNLKGLAAVSSSFFASLLASFGKYDIVHYHAEGPSSMLWLPKLFGKKVVVTIHGLDWQRAKWSSFASMYIKFGEYMAAKYADEIIVLSKNVQKYFKSEYERNTLYIPNGVSSPIISRADMILKKFDLSKNSYILFLGRLVPEKGIDYLIDAFKKIKTDKKLVIAGGSSDSEPYANSIRNKASDDNRIIFTGFVQGQVLQELYSNAYLYVLPSDVDGMPLSLLEAMSYGNCCLTSDILECTEVTEDKALHFKKSDAVDLQNKLQMALDDPCLVNKLKEDATNFVCKRFNWDDVVTKTIDIYKSLSIYDK